MEQNVQDSKDKKGGESYEKERDTGGREKKRLGKAQKNKDSIFIDLTY